jgi:uncharacterized protein (DUF2252 family)
MTLKKSKQSKGGKKQVAASDAKTAARMGRGRGGKSLGPVEIIERSNEGRLIDLVPIRHSRMLVSPFTYYRGAAAVMAADLDKESSSDIVVQSCGDCHILNCGAFATPERNIIIDLNDFDETHPAPFEWDLKRLVTSMVLALSSGRVSAKFGQEVAYMLARAYQKHMSDYAEQRLLDVWYSTIDYQRFVDKALDKSRKKLLKKSLIKERRKSSPEMLEEKLIEREKGQIRFKELPPYLFHRGDISEQSVEKAYGLYLKSLSADRLALLRHFEIADFATKVVGTGSVGTFCGVLLLVGPNDDLLILQVKEARPSVLEPYTQASRFENHGQRIVAGQRIMQSASDFFLGWSVGEKGRHFYVRQLRDIKMSPTPELWTKRVMPNICNFAGHVLAKAHAKSGEAPAITEYIGKSDKFAREMAKFASAYAEKTVADYQIFVEACSSGRLPTMQSEVG